MEQRLLATGRCRANTLALGGFAPVGGRRDCAVVGGEADQHRFTGVFFTRELADIELATLAHFGRTGVAEMGIMLQDGNLRASNLPTEILNRASRVSALCRSRRFHDDTSSRNTDR